MAFIWTILTILTICLTILTYAVGAYMLLDSEFTIPGEKAEIRSPVIESTSGCLDLTFHYYLYGTSTSMELSVHAITAG